MGATDIFLERSSVKDRKFTDEQIAQTLQRLLEHGIKYGASGLHIEPRERHVLVRYRVGGTLNSMHKLPLQSRASLLRHLKMLAGLDPLETYAPQEGGFVADIGSRSLYVTVSIMPVLGGEKAVLHLLAEPIKGVELENLGFWGEGLNLIRETLARPYGLVLVAAQRRGGLTTTLNSLQHLLHAGANSNIAATDNLYGKTALESAIHTALHGRLVLAGIHADGAIHGLLTVRSLGLEPFLLASAFRLAIGQRLVRRLCPDCQQRYELTERERQKLQTKLGITTPAQTRKVHALEQVALQSGIGQSPLSSTANRITHLWRANKDGCEACRNGFKGFATITEVLPTSEHVQKKLLDRAPTARTLHQAALKDGFVPMELDGLVKALRGLTTIEEVLNERQT